MCIGLLNRQATAMTRQESEHSLPQGVRMRSAVCLGLLLSFCTTLKGANPTTSPAERIASWQLIGGAGNPDDRLVPRQLFYRGWSTCMDKLITPQIRWGCRRLFLRNPFGTSVAPSGEHWVHFTQYQQALKQTPWLTQDFVPQWKNVTRQGIEVVAYIGNP